MTAQNLPSEPEFEQAYKGMCHLISTRHTANEKKKKIQLYPNPQFLMMTLCRMKFTSSDQC